MKAETFALPSHVDEGRLAYECLPIFPPPAIATHGFIGAVSDVFGDLNAYVNRSKETKARSCISKQD